MKNDLRAVDALKLPDETQSLLRPGRPWETVDGAVHHLPRFFYELASWRHVKEAQIGEYFRLSEMMYVDCRETRELLCGMPHYVPCAVLILARYLDEFRRRAGAAVFIATNGGYRSPSHQSAKTASPHHWAAAVDIYRVGDTFLDDEKAIEKYARVAESLGPGIHVKPYGHGPGGTDDHLHFDIGYVTLVPRECSE